MGNLFYSWHFVLPEDSTLVPKQSGIMHVIFTYN
jgi:hypothetical protein